MSYAFVAASLLLFASGCEAGKVSHAHAPGPLQQASATWNEASPGDAEADYLSAKRAYLASLDSDRKHGASDSLLNAHDEAAIRDLSGKVRRIFAPLRAEGFADSGATNVSTLLPTDIDFGALDGITYWSSDSMRVLVTTRGLLAGYLGERAAAGDALLPLDPVSALTHEELYEEVFPEDAMVLAYAHIPLDSAAQSAVVDAMLVARAQEFGPWTPDKIIVSVVRGNHIYFAEAAARALIAPMPACIALWERGRREEDSASGAPRSSNPTDSTAERLPSQSVEYGAIGDTAVRHCYADHVPADPRFASLVQQVYSIVRRLPSH